MRPWCRHISFRRVTRFRRKLVACAVVPVLLVSSLPTQAILIHSHHGHDIHGHTLAIHDLEEWRENSEHQHEEHEHDDQPTDPTEDEDCWIVIVLDLPVAHRDARGASSGVAVSNAAPATTVLAIDTSAASDGRPRTESQTFSAHPWRTRSLVADILSTSHALLL